MMIFKKKKDRVAEPKKKLTKKGEKPQPESDPIAEPQQKKLKIKEKKGGQKRKRRFLCDEKKHRNESFASNILAYPVFHFLSRRRPDHQT